MHKWFHRGAHICAQLCEGVEQMLRVRWTCIPVLMYVHILTIVWARGLSGLPRNRFTV